MCTVVLLSLDEWLLIERITDGYSQWRRVVLMLASVLKTINSVKTANNHFYKFLSASVSSL